MIQVSFVFMCSLMSGWHKVHFLEVGPVRSVGVKRSCDLARFVVVSKSFEGSKAQACALPLGSCILAMQTFGRNWTHCNLGCGPPFCRKSSRLETDDVQILCLILPRFPEIQKDSQCFPDNCLHRVNWLWLFICEHLTCSKAGQARESAPSTSRISGWCRSYACPFVWFHLNLSQQELDLRCDSRDSRKIFSLLRLCFKCGESIKLCSSRRSD